MKEKYIEINGIRTFYHKIGEGPPVVLVHGLGANWEMWGKLIPYLKNKFTVYALDLPGHGKSDKPDVSYGPIFFANFLINFIEATNLHKVVLIGESIGGQIAIKVASKRPDLVERLALVASSGLSPLFKGFFKVPGAAWVFTYIAGRWDRFNLWSYKRFFADKHYVSPGVFKEYMTRLNEPGAKRAYYRIIKSSASEDNGLWEELKKIIIPTLVVWGNDDEMMPVKDAYLITSIIKNSRLAVIYRCGHVPPVEKHREFNKTVLDFIE